MTNGKFYTILVGILVLVAAVFYFGYRGLEGVSLESEDAFIAEVDRRGAREEDLVKEIATLEEAVADLNEYISETKSVVPSPRFARYVSANGVSFAYPIETVVPGEEETRRVLVRESVSTQGRDYTIFAPLNEEEEVTHTITAYTKPMSVNAQEFIENSLLTKIGYAECELKKESRGRAEVYKIDAGEEAELGDPCFLPFAATGFVFNPLRPDVVVWGSFGQDTFMSYGFQVFVDSLTIFE